jgi:hypothetical protein
MIKHSPRSLAGYTLVGIVFSILALSCVFAIADLAKLSDFSGMLTVFNTILFSSLVSGLTCGCFFRRRHGFLRFVSVFLANPSTWLGVFVLVHCFGNDIQHNRSFWHELVLLLGFCVVGYLITWGAMAAIEATEAVKHATKAESTDVQEQSSTVYADPKALSSNVFLAVLLAILVLVGIVMWFLWRTM